MPEPGDVVRAPESWRAACAPLGASDAWVDHAIIAGNSDKASYFQALQRHTNLSRFRHVLPPSALRRLPTRPSVGFVGDSIMRELSMAWHGVAPNATSQYIWDDRVDLAAWRLASAANGSQQNHADRLPPHEAADVKRLAAALAAFEDPCGGLDALFVGGFALHRLLRLNEAENNGSLTTHPSGAASPVAQFESELRPWLRRLSRLASETQRPIVYVGAPTLHVAMRLLSPPTNSWDQFADASLLRVWGAVERRMERELARDSVADSTTSNAGAPPAGMAPGRASRLQSPLLFFLHPSELTSRCGAARCDGMHFGSDFKAYHCFSSMGLVVSFVGEYLQTTSGLAEALEAATHRRHTACHHTLAPGTPPTDDFSCRRRSAPWRMCAGHTGGASYVAGRTLGCHCYDETSLRAEQMTPWVHS
jgi:hypothetical protein